MQSGRLLKTLWGHDEYVTSVRFSPDGNRLVSTSGDNTMTMFSVAGGSFTPRQGSILLWDAKRIKLWDLGNRNEDCTLSDSGSSARCIAFSPDGKLLATGNYNQTIKIWDSQTGKEIRTLDGHQRQLEGIEFNNGGSLLRSSDVTGTQLIWEIETGNKINSDAIFAIVPSQNKSLDGRWLAVPNGNSVTLIDLEFKNTAE